MTQQPAMTAPKYLRLRQICLVAQDLDAVVTRLCATFGVAVCHRDPNVNRYGLHNALMPFREHVAAIGVRWRLLD